MRVGREVTLRLRHDQKSKFPPSGSSPDLGACLFHLAARPS